MAYSDRELLARLIECEAGGEGENGMKAVASVVMNRVTASGGEYARVGQGSIERSSCSRGSSSVRARRGGPTIRRTSTICARRTSTTPSRIGRWRATRLTGLGDALWFFNPFSDTCRQNFPSQVGVFRVRIGDHCFYDPTEAYYDT